MAEVQRNVRIRLVPRSRPEPAYFGDPNPKSKILSPIYFPAIITTDTTTGKFRVSVNIAGPNDTPDYKQIAFMNGAGIDVDQVSGIGPFVTAGGRKWDGTVRLQPSLLGFDDDGADILIKHLEAYNNLGELENIAGDRPYQKEFVITGLHYSDKKEQGASGLLLAKELSAGIFNENASVKERQDLVKDQGDQSYATAPTAEEIETDKKKNEKKTGETGDAGSEDENTETEPERQWDGRFDINPTAGFVPKFAGGTDLGRGILSYPENLEASQQDYLKISCFLYVPQTLELGRVSSPSGASAGEQQGPTVYLPITGASDSNNVGWGEQNANPLQIGLYQAAASFIDAGSMEDLGNVFSDLGKAAMGLINEDQMLRPAIKSYFAGQAAGVNGMLARTTGAVFNPNIVLLFNSPELRKFSFTFRMSARSQTEATQIRKIIRFFKQYSRPGTSGKQLFLTTPNVFTIEYKVPGNNGIHKSIGQPKGACALTSVGVNYVPDGSYMTFNDEARTMTSYDLTLNFSELEPIYQSDYTQEADHIGY
jgi:hypothetical protein